MSLSLSGRERQSRDAHHGRWCAQPMLARSRRYPASANPQMRPQRLAKCRCRLWRKRSKKSSLVSPLPVTPDGMGFHAAWLVSWLAGQCPLPPSRFPSGIWQGARRIQSRGRLRLKAPNWVSCTAFPYAPPCLAGWWGTMPCHLAQESGEGQGRFATYSTPLALSFRAKA